MACPCCCEDFHREEYVNRKGPENHTLMAKYRRKAIISRGTKMQDSHVAWICKHADRSNLDTEGVYCSEAYWQAATNRQVRKSTDFIYILHPGCALFYGGCFCRIVRLRRCSWWRTARPHN